MAQQSKDEKKDEGILEKYSIPQELFNTRLPNLPVCSKEREQIPLGYKLKINKLFKIFEENVKFIKQSCNIQQIKKPHKSYIVYIEVGDKNEITRYDLGITKTKLKARSIILQIVWYQYKIIYGSNGENMKKWTESQQLLLKYLQTITSWSVAEKDWNHLINILNSWCCITFKKKIQFKISNRIKIYY